MSRIYVAQNFQHLDVQSVADFLKRLNRHVLFAALDGAAISPMHSDLVSKAFLAIVLSFAMFANRSPDAHQSLFVPFHEGARYRPSFFSSTVYNITD